MKQLKRLVVIMFTIIFAVSMFIVPNTVYAAELGDMTGQVVVIHTNDTHGRAIADVKARTPQLGFARVKTLKAMYEKAGATVVTLDAGDVLHGLPIANMTKGENIVKILNQVGYDAMVPGNHDFNYGTARLLQFAGKDATYTGATFAGKILSANFAKDDNTKPLDSHIVIERGGKKIGIFGLSTKETLTKSHPDNTKGYKFNDIVATATEEVAALKALNCDYIIALTHLGLDLSSGNETSQYLAEQVTGINLIVDGHSHTTLTTGKLVNGALIVSAGNYIERIGVVVLNGASITASLVNDKTLEEEATTKALLTQLNAETETLLAEKVGVTSVTLNGIRNNVRRSQTNLGDFATDAMKFYGNAELAFTNGGGIRTNIEKGDITKKDLVTVFPFGNYVVTKTVSVGTIKAMLEHGIKDYPSTSGGFPQIAGFKYVFDGERSAGDRVISITIGKATVYKDGAYQPIVKGQPETYENKTYSLATNDFTAAGGDGYTMLKACGEIGQFGALEEALIAYLASGVDMNNYKYSSNRMTEVNKVIVDLRIDQNNMLVMVYNDGSTVELGLVKGDTGANGVDGTNGTNGTNGKDGVDGTNGTNGKDGVDGTNGTNGVDGTNGTNGTNGADGKPANNVFGIVSLVISVCSVTFAVIVLLKKKQ
ncbi:MAG: 5'-nucleotidase C-terminal domain-containing protein [Clostridia bacterium]